jgi:hypothetical protein
VALERVEVFKSDTVTPLSIATGVDSMLSPATNAADPESVVMTNGLGAAYTTGTHMDIRIKTVSSTETRGLIRILIFKFIHQPINFLFS